ncbi:inositol monophosphatase family protein [Martelella limonii]|uniref:inositol monophosphatase family protein n=1 Tax=Martelella limonii TaxID=1647649 RepID=UPI001580FB33|nr:inositol monophosphatase family protein [Martelella limonii]
MDVENAAALENRYALAERMAREGGAVAHQYFRDRGSLAIETKRDPQDVVSIADRGVEQLIRKAIAKEFPEDGVLGEEYGLEAGTSGFTWVIDPIDGTSAFLAGMPTWCVSIGLLHEGKAVVGVINAPCLDEHYAAAAGKGAFLNGERLLLTGAITPRNALTGIGANSEVSPQSVAAMVERLLMENGNFIRNGSGALMIAYVAAGRLAGYIEPSMHAWDCLAGYCLVVEAGGSHLPFPVEGKGLTGGAPVLAAGPGSLDALAKIAQFVEV